MDWIVNCTTSLSFYLLNVFGAVPLLVTGNQIVETGQNICDITVGGAHIADTN